MQYLFLSGSLHLVQYVRGSSVLLQMIGFPSFLKLVIFHCIHTSYSLYPFIHAQALKLFPYLGYYIISVTMNVEVQASFWNNGFISFGYIPRSGIARSYGSSIFNFWGNIHDVFHSFCTSLHCHQQCSRALFSPHSHAHLFSLVFLIISFLTDGRWYLIVILNCIILMTSDVDHLFIW